MTTVETDSAAEPPHDMELHGETELHSEKESFRKALVLRDPHGSKTTLLVLRRRKAVWLTFSGAEKTTVTMSVAETDDLIDTLRTARGGQDQSPGVDPAGARSSTA